MAKGRSEVADRRYTVMWVPQGGRGKVRQLTLTMRQVRWLAVTAVFVLGLCVMGVGLMAASVPRSQACDSLLEENLTLKGRLQDIDRKLGEMDDQLRRLRMYEQQLQESQIQGFSGYGPVDSDEVDLSTLPEDDGIAELDIDPVTGEFGEPMHELDGLELEPTFLSTTDAWSHDISQRVDNMLALAREMEPAVGLMVESAEDARARRSAYPSAWPVNGRFTSGYGYRRSPFNKILKFHSGIDISAPRGTKIRSASSGVVSRAAYTGGYGKLVVVDHGYGVQSAYAHNAQIFVKTDQVVQQGQVIGTVGTTGHSTGPHLHFEVMVDGRKVNPMAYLPRHPTSGRANSRPSP
jgi:hypothetical protein